jgi:Zn finger protein HypA/HybF involved in hydrogenase expression
MSRKSTTEDFINKARSIHGSLYNYDDVSYINSHTKVNIGCKRHSYFYQQPLSHLSGHGCPECGDEKRRVAFSKNALSQKLDTNSFVVKAIKTHGDTYDYTRVFYEHSEKHIFITCKQHGEFKQTPHSHLQGCGCPHCGKENISAALSLVGKSLAIPKEFFVEKANLIHNSYYDYSKICYTKASDMLFISCPVHGEFKQSGILHLKGRGCRKCHLDGVNDKDIFIKKALAIHGNTYDYSKTDLRNRQLGAKVIITCRKHGDFSVEPSRHVSPRTKYGCALCGNDVKISKTIKRHQGNKKKYLDKFLAKAASLHRDKYDYYMISIENYVDQHTKLPITCKKHGVFYQTPNSHLQGTGCPKCSKVSSKKENLWLDSLNITNLIRYKRIVVPEAVFYVDGYVEDTKTVYEFFGDYWHGNPKVFSQKNINANNKRSFGVLYLDTLYKISCLERSGYSVVYIWESDWDLLRKT